VTEARKTQLVHVARVVVNGAVATAVLALVAAAFRMVI
jgi:hypothetical protein